MTEAWHRRASSVWLRIAASHPARRASHPARRRPASKVAPGPSRPAEDNGTRPPPPTTLPPTAFTIRRSRIAIATHVPRERDGPTEADIVVDQYLQATTTLSGLTGYAYDRALRRRHLDRLLKHGHLGLVGTHRQDGKPRRRHHGPERLRHADGTTSTVDLHLIGGHPHVVTHDADGNRQAIPLVRTKVIRRAPRSSGGPHRMYAEYAVPDTPGLQGGTVRLRLDQTRADTARRYNRPEHLRAFPEHDPIFKAVQHPLRAAAESANRIIDDHLPRERLLHYGFSRNTISMYAWQAYRNTLTAAVFTPSRTATGVDPPTGQIAA